MKRYRYKAHPTRYKDVLFRSRLEARWAAFFDLCGWEWEYEPIDLYGWTPDFRITFPCGHSECNGSHTLLVEVKPYYDLKEFKGHPCMKYEFGTWGDEIIPADGSAAFGANPIVTYFTIVHGCGGGVFRIVFFLNRGWEKLWRMAGTKVRWKPE